MTFGIALYDAAGSLIWDSNSALDGCAIDLRRIAAGASPVFTYPALAGRSVVVQFVESQTPFLLPSGDPGDGGVTTDTTLGYPRVTVASRGFDRTILVYADFE